MNWKAISTGGIIGVCLSFFIGFVYGLIGIYSSGLVAVTNFISLFIGCMITGILSPNGAWKNGIMAGILIVISSFLINSLIIGVLPIALIPGGLIVAVIIGVIGGF